ncbi:hypothetical protein [Spirochaeta africana]|nr:hypothetical protein [Spirochaeta africana]
MARRLQKLGMSIAQVAEIVDASPEQVTDWLAEHLELYPVGHRGPGT